jgi:hypothetical protein
MVLFVNVAGVERIVYATFTTLTGNGKTAPSPFFTQAA